MPDRTCSVADCGKKAQARGLCPMHYQRQRTRGDVGGASPERQPVKGLLCTVEGCGQPRRKRTWCASHYSQWQRTGEAKPFTYKWADPTPCKICGDPPGAGLREFCSSRCRALWSAHGGDVPEAVTCRACGTSIPLVRLPSGYRKRADTRFCDGCVERGERDRDYRRRTSGRLASGKRAWKQKNRAAINARSRELARLKPDLIAARNRRYLRRYPNVISERNHRRRARLRRAFVAPVDRQQIWKRDAGLCGICGGPAEPTEWHLDHIVPLSRGGSHEPRNVQVSHPTCNLRKGAQVGPKEASSG